MVTFEAADMSKPFPRLHTKLISHRKDGASAAERHLAALSFIDVVGYTRLMELDERTTHAKWIAMRADMIEPAARRNGARFLKSTGDGLLIEFGSGLEAVTFALETQKHCANSSSAADALPIRISIHL